MLLRAVSTGAGVSDGESKLKYIVALSRGKEQYAGTKEEEGQEASAEIQRAR